MKTFHLKLSMALGGPWATGISWIRPLDQNCLKTKQELVQPLKEDDSLMKENYHLQPLHKTGRVKTEIRKIKLRKATWWQLHGMFSCADQISGVLHILNLSLERVTVLGKKSYLVMPQGTQLLKVCTLNFLPYEDHRKDCFQLTTGEHSNISIAIYFSSWH